MISGNELLFSETFQVFLIFSQTNNINQCALHAGLSPSSVSRHISNLEKIVGTELVERKRRPLQLTEEGKRLARALQEQVETMGGILSEIRNLNKSKPILKIAFIESFRRVSCRFIPEILPYVSKILSFCAHSTDHILNYLLSGQVDMIVTSDSLDEQTVKKSVLLRENTMLVIPKKNELANSNQLQWSNLQFIGCPFIRSYFNSNSGRSVDAFFNANAIKINNQIEVDNVGVKISLIAKGLGWSIIPQMSLYEYQDVLSEEVLKNVKILPTPYPKLYRQLYAIGSLNAPDKLYQLVVSKLSSALSKVIPEFEKKHKWWSAKDSITLF